MRRYHLLQTSYKEYTLKKLKLKRGGLRHEMCVIIMNYFESVCINYSMAPIIKVDPSHGPSLTDSVRAHSKLNNACPYKLQISNKNRKRNKFIHCSDKKVFTIPPIVLCTFWQSIIRQLGIVIILTWF